MFIIAALLAAATPTVVCKTLQQKFESNEKMMAWSHDFHSEVYEIQADLYSKTGRLIERLERDASARKIEYEDRKHLEEGDRITTLMIANKCQPPDHITSWYRHSKRNPKNGTKTDQAP